MNFYSSLIRSWQFTLLLIFIGIFLIFPVWQSGLIVGGDWTFPYTKEQLYEFYTWSKSNWHFRDLPTGSQLQHNNIYPFQLMAGLFYFLGASGIIFQKVLLSVIMVFGGCISFFAFVKITNNRFASLVASIAYLFSPIFFNYLSMGWIFVLFFMAVLPLIVLLVDSYFKYGNWLPLISLGLISSIAFAQSQVVVWVPIIIFVFAISLWISDSFALKYILRKFFMLLGGVLCIVFVTHMFWIIPVLSGTVDYIGIKNISSYDLSRFNVLNANNLIRGWGALYNAQFEQAFNTQLVIFSFFAPIVLCALLLSTFKSHKYVVFSTLLILLPFVIFLSGPVIAELPFSNIIRDFNRFIVLSNFGYALAIALLFSKINSTGFRVLGLGCLLISIHPFLGQTLFNWADTQAANTSLRFLNVPDKEVEEQIDQFAGQKNLLLPTGAHIGSINDPRFKKSFAEISDFDTNFSQNAAGIYISDKSPPLIRNFADQYIHSAMEDKEVFLTLSRIYGIDNLLIRKGLYSSYDREFNSTNLKRLGCQSIPGRATSDWSINNVCKIKNSYPIIYSPQRVINSYGNSMSNIVKNFKLIERNGLVAIIGCPSDILFYDKAVCVNQEDFNFQTPKIEFYKIEENTYRVGVTKIHGNYILVLNQTLHDGWRIRDARTKEVLQYQKILVNQLVNGWLVTTNNAENSQEFIIDFAPRGSSHWLRYVSLIFLALHVVLIGLLKLIGWGTKKRSLAGS